MGVHNGLWKLLFWVQYGAFVWLTVHNIRTEDAWPGLGASVFFLAFWALMAAHFATVLHKEICGIVNDLNEDEYARARAVAARSMPVEALKLDPDTDDFIDVRRPLMDPRIGLTVRR